MTRAKKSPQGAGMDEMISGWIRASGINPIFLGWIGALCVLALIRHWWGE
jgi:hypothetical protein